MKKLLAMLLAATMMLALVACGDNSGSSDSEGGLTLNSGKLMVGVEIGYPPMEYFDEDGTTPIGFDIEMMTEVAKRMGLELEIIDTAWDGIFAGLDSNRYDMIMSSCSITPSRQENYTISTPYVQNAIELLVPIDSDITGIDAVSGRTVAVQGETSSHDYLRDNETGCEIKDYDKVINCFDELKLGRVDSVLTDSVVAAYYLGDAVNNYSVVWVNNDAEPIGAFFKKGNDTLCAEINRVLDEMAADGTTAAIATKYFGNTASVDGVR